MEIDYKKIGQEVDAAVETLLSEFAKDGDGKPRYGDGVFKRELAQVIYPVVLEDKLRRQR